jgi:hypothetical protein
MVHGFVVSAVKILHGWRLEYEPASRLSLIAFRMAFLLEPFDLGL